MSHIYVGILAGGSGERLWPLSRINRPKQLIPFVNEQSLLEQTIERVLQNDRIEKSNIFIVMCENYILIFVMMLMKVFIP